MRNFKAGDIVKVKNWGRSYSTNTNWFISHKDELKVEWIARYAYENHQFFEYYTPYSDNNEYEILYLSGEYALITPVTSSSDSVYLIGIDALFSKVYTFSMSEAIRKLEDVCGGSVEIVGGDGDEHNQSI